MRITLRVDLVVSDSDSVDSGRRGFRPDDILNRRFRCRLEVHVHVELPATVGGPVLSLIHI